MRIVVKNVAPLFERLIWHTLILHLPCRIFLLEKCYMREYFPNSSRINLIVCLASLTAWFPQNLKLDDIISFVYFLIKPLRNSVKSIPWNQFSLEITTLFLLLKHRLFFRDTLWNFLSPSLLWLTTVTCRTLKSTMFPSIISPPPSSLLPHAFSFLSPPSPPPPLLHPLHFEPPTTILIPSASHQSTQPQRHRSSIPLFPRKVDLEAHQLKIGTT